MSGARVKRIHHLSFRHVPSPPGAARSTDAYTPERLRPCVAGLPHC